MKKIIFKKFLIDYLFFFLVSTISISAIIWVFQSVNYLDIIVEDGRDYAIYFKFTLLTFPKIIIKIIPFSAFFSLTYILNKYETNNELIIFWNFGIQKIEFVNFLFKISIFFFSFQILMSSLIVPASLDKARSILRTSSINLVEDLLKEKKFNDIIKGLTIHTENKDENGNLYNIYLKRNFVGDEFEITYAKKGIFKKINNNQYLILYNGENINGNSQSMRAFNFSETRILLQDLDSDVMKTIKTQEVKSKDLIRCYNSIKKKELDTNKIIFNCSYENSKDILREIYKRFISPIYVIVLILIASLLLLSSKEKIEHLKIKLLIFSLGFLIIVTSEISLRFVEDTLKKNIYIVSIPFILIAFTYFYLLLKLDKKLIK